MGTGYHDEGLVWMRPAKIAQRYMTRLFLLELTVVVADWVLLFTQAEAKGAVDVARAGKIFRVIRILRILRLLRVMKFLDVSAKLTDIMMSFRTYSEGIFEFMGLFKLLGSVIVINHFIACLWYWLGENGDSADSWLDMLDEQNASMIYRYICAFHWALCQFTPAPNNFHPQNAQERGFAIFTLLFGFTMFSSFLGSITSLLTHIRNTATKRTLEDERIRQFLVQNNVSLTLGNRVTTFLRQRRNRTMTRVLECDAKALMNLPGSLLMELHYEVYAKVFVAHPLFWNLDNNKSASVGEISHEAMSQCLLSKGDELFDYGVEAMSMYFIIADSLEYKKPSAARSVVIEPGDWLSEAVLWVRWWHRGRLTSNGFCNIMILNAETFRRIVACHLNALKACQRYGKFFLESISKEMFPADNWSTFDIAQDFAQRSFEEEDMPEQLPDHNILESFGTQGTMKKGTLKRAQTFGKLGPRG